MTPWDSGRTRTTLVSLKLGFVYWFPRYFPFAESFRVQFRILCHLVLLKRARQVVLRWCYTRQCCAKSSCRVTWARGRFSAQFSRCKFLNQFQKLATCCRNKLLRWKLSARCYTASTVRPRNPVDRIIDSLYFSTNNVSSIMYIYWRTIIISLPVANVYRLWESPNTTILLVKGAVSRLCS